MQRPRSIAFLLLTSTMLIVLFGCHPLGAGGAGRQRFAQAKPVRPGLVEVAPFVNEKSARRDPLRFLRFCAEHYRRHVSDYRCRFHMREWRGGRLRPEEVLAVRFRQAPLSVDLRWLNGGGLARRVSYVAGRWTRDGRERALVHPAGFLGLLLPGGVRRDIHGADMAGASRYPIDQFGFLHTLERFLDDCVAATGIDGYHLRYVGRGEFDHRPTYVFERRLPDAARDEAYPERLYVMHVDAGWLVPTASYLYADEDKTLPIGRYLTTAVEFNVGLTDKDFR